MDSPQVSADRIPGDVKKEEGPAVERPESVVFLCIEESSRMTSDEHSTDSASFPSLTDVITDNDITDDVTTTDLTTDDIITVSVSPEPTLTADWTGSAAAAPPFSSTGTPPCDQTTPLSRQAPPLEPLPSLPAALPQTSSSIPRTASEASPTGTGPDGVGPAEGEEPATQGAGPDDQGAGPASQGAGLYQVKWINWKHKQTPVVTQSQNGPCPLLAIINTLLLRWKVKFPAQTEVVTTEELMTHLGECVLSVTPREKSQGEELNFQQNISDVMSVLPKLCTGLDVNVRFTGVSDFEFTPECIVFDLLDIALYHGWLLDPQSPEAVAAVGKLSYNQLVEKIIDCKHSSDSSKVSQGLAAEQFLDSTASQLSYHGLCELTSKVTEGEICVLFRNNHFSTMVKTQGHLYLLVTDQFLSESVVWESLHNVEGDGNFCDADFRLKRPDPVYNQSTDQDFLVAVSLQQQEGDPVSLSDAELARQLQQEEYQSTANTANTTSTASTASTTAPAQARSQTQSTRRRDKDSDCVLL
ncbi:unnamed protein product [Knipowitschia caucasica]